MLIPEPAKDHAWIAAHIPHKGAMCLLDAVLDWSESEVRCLCRSHRSVDNPLRARGRLAAVCAVEIAAQAIAVHGALLAPPQQSGVRAGFLVGVRNVSLHRARLDDIEADLVATVKRFGGDDTSMIYDFDLRAQSEHLAAEPLASGRAMIVLSDGSGA